jgi:hypothetical protein
MDLKIFGGRFYRIENENFKGEIFKDLDVDVR